MELQCCTVNLVSWSVLVNADQARAREAAVVRKRNLAPVSTRKHEVISTEISYQCGVTRTSKKQDLPSPVHPGVS
jgi:hypothetical protein